jgi:hypothetical protein
MPYNSVAYLRESGGPGELEKHIADVQGSGLTTVIVGMLHVGNPDDPDKDKAMQFGDFIYNNYPAALIVRDGEFNPDDPEKTAANKQAIAKWPEQVARLKQPGSSVRNVFLSVGSPPDYWPDFANIGKMLAQDNGAQLNKNLVALKEAFTFDGRCVIDGFDIDYEETLDKDGHDTVVQFCEMVFGLGFKVTFCPYQVGDESWWRQCMQSLWDKGMKVSWWNLQCYSGGIGNLHRLEPWIEALGKVVGGDGAPYLVPGLGVKGVPEKDLIKSDQRCPCGTGGIEDTATSWKNPRLGGAFLWRYEGLADHPEACDNQNKLANYVKAINSGLRKG